MRKLSKDGGTVVVNIRMPGKLVNALRRDATLSQVTLSRFLRACILKGRKASIEHFANRAEIG